MRTYTVAAQVDVGEGRFDVDPFEVQAQNAEYAEYAALDVLSPRYPFAAVWVTVTHGRLNQEQAR